METPLKGINRRQFLGSTAVMAAAPAWVGSAAAAVGQESGKPASLVEVIRELAPEGVSLKPGPGFAMERNGAMLGWKLDSLESETGDLWKFRYRSEDGLEAAGSLRLDRAFRVAETRVKLTNTAGGRSLPLTRLYSLFLRLGGVTDPRIMGCSGAGSASWFPHAREFPSDAFRPRWIEPFHYRPVEFASHRNLTGCPTGSCEVAVPVKQRGFGERWTGSSSQDLPLFMVSQGPDSDQPGLFFGIEWSTFWQARVAFDGPPTDLKIEVGPLIKDLVLDPGESLDLPVVHLGFFEKGFESGTNGLRRYIHQRLTPHYRGKPMVPHVAYTLWPGISVTYTEEELRRQVDAAAEAGVEMFCVDADWYKGGHSRGRGNWEVDPEKFPRGMEPFAEYVRSKGMGMGLYFEAVAFPWTNLPQAHPEYFYKLPEGFHPLKYNFSSPEACDHWIDLIGGFVERYDLRYIRADFYTDPMRGEESFHWDLVDSDGKTRFAHVRGLYRVWETLTRRHPRLMLELNAGGGNAIDLGSLRRHHCAWANDMSGHPHSCRMIQLGANSFIPANYMGLAVGPDREGRDNGLDAGFSDQAFLSRMTGQMLLHGGLAAWPPEVLQRARHWVGVYKKIRPLLVKDFYRLLSVPNSEADWDAAQFCDGTREGVVFVFRYLGRRPRHSVFLQSLDAGRRYRLKDEGTGESRVLSGNELMHGGLTVPLAPNSARLFSYRAE